MATIELEPDNVLADVYWLHWIERGEIIGKVDREPKGLCRITPQGPHWSPMKSFAGNSFRDPQQAAEEVRIYFAGR